MADGACRIRISEAETVALIEASVRNYPLPLSFGASGVFLIASSADFWAVKKLAELRGIEVKNG